jgi:hypothetical protein
LLFFLVFAFLFVSLSLCEACCMAFGTNAPGEGDVAWSLTTLWETTDD